MEYPEHEKFAHEGLTKALLSGLEMALEGDKPTRSPAGTTASGLASSPLVPLRLVNP